jgi:hypothetical protein
MCNSSTMNPWIGSTIPHKRILILGESWYGTPTALTAYLAAWCTGSVRDYLFSRVFNTGSGRDSRTASISQRTAFWNSVLFDNFVNWSVGAFRSSRPKPGDFASAARSFPSRISALCPTSVWVLGLTHARYSVPLLGAYHHVVSPHPCGFGVTAMRLKADWAKL